MNPFGDHIIRHAFFHFLADLIPGNSRRAMEGDDPCCSMVCERPSHRCHQVCAQNLAQMRLDFFELDPVAEYLDLVVNSTQVVKCPGKVFVSQVSSAIPTIPLQRWKARCGQVWILEVSAR